MLAAIGGMAATLVLGKCGVRATLQWSHEHFGDSAGALQYTNLSALCGRLFRNPVLGQARLMFKQGQAIPPLRGQRHGDRGALIDARAVNANLTVMHFH